MDNFISKIAELLNSFDDLIWGPPLLVLLIGIGLLLTVSLRFVQVKRLPLALRYIVSLPPYRGAAKSKGEISSFAALCTALGATIGTGNIVGVATAVSLGGPGALFWMFVAAFLGMATKYAECLLAVKFRETKGNGYYVGGPMYYIKNGIGPKHATFAKILAVAFAVFGIMAGCLGIGTYTQLNAIVDAASQFQIPKVNCAILLTVILALIILGGLRSVSAASKKLVPLMGIFYVVSALCVLWTYAEQIPAAIRMIFEYAFTPASAIGGFTGATVLMAIQKGIARGVFSNEAGLGSAPIVAASARTNHPVEQGLVNMTGTFIDTIIICMMTGLTLIITGAWCSESSGAAMTTLAFTTALGPTPGACAVNLSLMLFAFTTILGWSSYAEKCAVYLFGLNCRIYFRIVFILFVASYILIVMYVDMNNISDRTAINSVWVVSDIANGLMAFPNLIALFMLRKVVVSETVDYFRNFLPKAKRQ
jgi:AGCS family alanine or glycine:cation symporter